MGSNPTADNYFLFQISVFNTKYVRRRFVNVWTNLILVIKQNFKQHMIQHHFHIPTTLDTEFNSFGLFIKNRPTIGLWLIYQRIYSPRFLGFGFRGFGFCDLKRPHKLRLQNRWFTRSNIGYWGITTNTERAHWFLSLYIRF